jgi:hypothetical protein
MKVTVYLINKKLYVEKAVIYSIIFGGVRNRSSEIAPVNCHRLLRSCVDVSAELSDF